MSRCTASGAAGASRSTVDLWILRARLGLTCQKVGHVRVKALQNFGCCVHQVESVVVTVKHPLESVPNLPGRHRRKNTGWPTICGIVLHLSSKCMSVLLVARFFPLNIKTVQQDDWQQDSRIVTGACNSSIRSSLSTFLSLSSLESTQPLTIFRISLLYSSTSVSWHSSSKLLRLQICHWFYFHRANCGINVLLNDSLYCRGWRA